MLSFRGTAFFLAFLQARLYTEEKGPKGMKGMEKTRCQSCFREFEGAVCPHCGGAQNEEHQLPVGTMLHGRYQIGKVLGQGGFGITYLGRDKLLGNTVAVKEFYPGSTVFRQEGDTTVRCINKTMIPHYEYSKERFLREANALVKFKDIPQIVDILDFSEEYNTAYIIMEYVKGVDLAKYIQMKGGKLSVEETFRILKPVMEALAKVHKGGIVHRDISPDNIILDPMGGAKLLDFGAVRAVEDPDVNKGLNKSTEAILKQGFAPIEQYNTRGNLGPWTDEYAMCATVWYCLTGRIPEEASIRMSEGIDPDWSSIPGLPEHQRRALQKGISCRAKDRYESMDALLAELFPPSKEPKPVPLKEPKPKKEKAPKPPKEPKPKIEKAPKPPKEPKPRKEKAPKPPKEPKPKLEKPPKPPKEPKTATEQEPKLHKKPAAAVGIAVAAVVLLCLLIPALSGRDTAHPELQVPDVTDGTDAAVTETEPTEETLPIQTEPPTTAPPLSPEEQSYLMAEQLLAEGKLGEAAIAFGKLSGHSDARERSLAIWDQITERDTLTFISTGGSAYSFAYAVREDGTAVTVGINTGGPCDADGWTDIVSISAHKHGAMGLKADGTVVVSKSNSFSGVDEIASWTDIVAIYHYKSGSYPDYTIGLRLDGTVVAAGDNTYGQCDIEDWTDIVKIYTSNRSTVGLKTDGTVVMAGSGYYYDSDDAEGWSDIVEIPVANVFYVIGLKADGAVVYSGSSPYFDLEDLEDWTDIVDIPAGNSEYVIGLKADGTVVMAGSVYFRDTLLFDQQVLENWTDIVAVSAGDMHIVGLRSDGTVVAAGSNAHGQINVTDWTDIVAIHTSDSDSMYERTYGLKADGTVVAVGQNDFGLCDVKDWTDIVAIYYDGITTIGLKADGSVAIRTGAWRLDSVADWTDLRMPKEPVPFR